MLKIIKRRKQKLSQLYRLAKMNDMSLAMTIDSLRQQHLMTHAHKKEKKYGAYLLWDNAEHDESFLHVPVHCNKDGKLLYVQAFIDEEMLPQDKQHLWSIKGNEESSL